MYIRNAESYDEQKIAYVEKRCFPDGSGATAEDFQDRILAYPKHIWLLVDGMNVVSLADGIATDEPDIRDEMYTSTALHQEDGDWQTLFGLDTVPEFRKRGYASKLLNRVIQDAKRDGRKGIVLVCRSGLTKFYENRGFKNEGRSASTHCGDHLYQMRLTF
ncbi:MAG: GNAT family N-acetyltransferase [Acutalibacteraceae bacterium]